MADFDSVCAALCLLTNAAAGDDMPQPVSRAAMRRLLSGGALCGLVLRETAQVDSALLERARVLLSRAKHVYDCLERYRHSGYDVILPSDEIWPERLYALGDKMPQFLFLRGNRELLLKDKVSVAGSRDILPAVLQASGSLGCQLVKEGYCLVSGGARGVDTAVQKGVLEHGGQLILVPAQPAERLLKDETIARALAEGRLLLLCDTLPDDRFSPQRAIARNHVIYALGEAAVVVAAREGIGGSWHGAMDCLCGDYTQLWTIDGEDEDYAGNRALLQKGASALDMKRDLSLQCFAQEAYDQTNLFSVIENF